MIGGEKLKLPYGLQPSPSLDFFWSQGYVCVQKWSESTKNTARALLSPLPNSLNIHRGCTRNWVCKKGFSGLGRV